MEVGNVCDSEKKYINHLCMLRERGLISTIEHLTEFPNFVCLRCGELANSDENTCVPFPLFI
jgi:hypothetical protein